MLHLTDIGTTLVCHIGSDLDLTTFGICPLTQQPTTHLPRLHSVPIKTCCKIHFLKSLWGSCQHPLMPDHSTSGEHMFKKICWNSVWSILAVLALGCGANPGAWSIDQIQNELKAKIPAENVTLTLKSVGQYEGTAVGKADGKKTYKLTVKQDASNGTLNWTAETPDGDTVTGSFSEVNKF